MALKLNLTLKDNFLIDQNFRNSYVKVAQVKANKESAIAIVNFFSEKEGVSLKTENFEFSINLNGSNFIAQAYEHLKTLPEFDGAVDC
jgi:hypothetical protein